jgi:hypothetical protein
MPFRHVVMFKFADHVTPEMIADTSAALTKLPTEIDAIRNYVHGADVGVSEGNFDYVVVADFDDVAGYLTYRDHPAHQAVVTEHIAPIVAERTAVQYRLED